MKEFIEKLIERLEQMGKEHPQSAGDDYLDGYETGYNVCTDDAIEAVNQLAEEYKRCYKPSCKDCEVYDKEKHYCPKWCEVIKRTTNELAAEHKGGWIACSGCKDCQHKECEHYGKG